MSHHEILEVIAPVLRSGRRLDMQASDRMARRLVFQPTANAELRETLALQVGGSGRFFTLTRTLCPEAGPPARLQANGTELDTLLACVDAVAPQQQCTQHPDVLVARHLHVVPGGAPAMTGAEVWVQGLSLQMRVPPSAGLSAHLELRPAEPANALPADALPDDLMAVLGWAWSPLQRVVDGWHCSVRLRGRGGERSRDAEAQLDKAARYLARTLGEAEPAETELDTASSSERWAQRWSARWRPRWHMRWRWARWGVALRRSIPVLVCGGMLIELAAAGPRQLAQGPGVHGAMLLLGTALLLLFFMRSEGPRVELPPWPR